MNIKLIILMISFLLSSCAHKFTVADMEGVLVGDGTAQEFSHELTINLKGKSYVGEWAFDGFSRMGKGIAMADNGAMVSCEFIYRGLDGTGLGTCEDKSGKKYSIKIHN